MKMTVRFEGFEEIARKLDAMGSSVRRETIEPIMREELQPMADEMRALAPRRTGELADSITVSTELSPAQAAKNVPIAEIEVYVGPGPLPQAIQEEFGNYHQKPEPFIRPAYDSHRDSAARNIGERGVEAILKSAKKG